MLALHFNPWILKFSNKDWYLKDLRLFSYVVVFFKAQKRCYIQHKSIKETRTLRIGNKIGNKNDNRDIWVLNGCTDGQTFLYEYFTFYLLSLRCVVARVVAENYTRISNCEIFHRANIPVNGLVYWLLYWLLVSISW